MGNMAKHKWVEKYSGLVYRKCCIRNESSNGNATYTLSYCFLYANSIGWRNNLARVDFISSVAYGMNSDSQLCELLLMIVIDCPKRLWGTWPKLLAKFPKVSDNLGRV